MRTPITVLVLALAGCPKSEPVPSGERPLLLWQVERDGVVSHLFGTCHVTIPMTHALPAPHDRLLGDARVVVSEIDLEALAPMAALGAMWAPEHARLSEQLSPEAWRAVSVRMRDTVPASMLDRLPAWGVYSTMVAETPAGPAGTPVLDNAVAARATEAGAERVYLETFEQQVALLGSLDHLFVELLSPGSAAAEQLALQTDVLTPACRDGETGPFEALIDDPAYQESLGPMFSKRNEAWMPPLLHELGDGGAFVAVGAGHMLGRDGLLARLGAEGFTITRVAVPRARRGEWAPEGPVGSASPIVSVPPASPEQVAAWTGLWSQEGGLVDLLCADDGVVRMCFESDAHACDARLTRGLALCVSQFDDRMPSEPGGPLPDTTAQDLVGCGMSEMLLDALLTDRFGDAPMCTEMRAGIEASMAEIAP